MNVKIYYTEHGISCMDCIELPEDAVHSPNIGVVLNKFHGKKQIKKRYSNEIVDGERVRHYWYEKGLLPSDYHVHKAVCTGNTDHISQAGRFTYEFTENQKTPNMWKDPAKPVIQTELEIEE